MYNHDMDAMAAAIYETYMEPQGMKWAELSRKLGYHDSTVRNAASQGQSPAFWRKVCETMGWDWHYISDMFDITEEQEIGDVGKLTNDEVLRRMCEVDILYGIEFFEDIKRRDRLTSRVLQVALEYGLINERDAASLGILPPANRS